MGSTICFGASIFSTTLLLNALFKRQSEDNIIFHALITSIQWGMFYSTLK